MGVKEAVAELFSRCTPNSAGLICEFSAVVKVLWPILDNNVSLCDLSGIFTISIPASNDGDMMTSASTGTLPAASGAAPLFGASSPLRRGGPTSPGNFAGFSFTGSNVVMGTTGPYATTSGVPPDAPPAAVGLDTRLFTEFLTAIAQIKFGSVPNGLERLLNEIMNAKSVHFGADTALFNKLIDRNVIRVLLKYDLPLRRAFCAFAGSAARVGGRLSWDEVKAQNIGMEVCICMYTICLIIA
jgi:hypothetical protein